MICDIITLNPFSFILAVLTIPRHVVTIADLPHYFCEESHLHYLKMYIFKIL